MIPKSVSISTGNHLATRRTRFPFHNTVIQPLGDIDSLIIINIQTVRVSELIDSIAFSISSSHSETILLPFGIRVNVNSRCS
jgi:spore coat polysaccharide biosynthesis protein SpsF (cytidylyltransferase family)